MSGLSPPAAAAAAGGLTVLHEAGRRGGSAWPGVCSPPAVRGAPCRFAESPVLVRVFGGFAAAGVRAILPMLPVRLFVWDFVSVSDLC